MKNTGILKGALFGATGLALLLFPLAASNRYQIHIINMAGIYILISLGLALGFLACFIWAVKSGQYEDTCTPGMRILTEDKPVAGPGIKSNPNQT